MDIEAQRAGDLPGVGFAMSLKIKESLFFDFGFQEWLQHRCLRRPGSGNAAATAIS
jgi:hypothetical protein